MFRSVFIAVVIAFALIVGAFLINRARPKVETEQPTASLVRASGKCAECHLRTQYAVVHEYEMSMHAQKGVNCLDCHQPIHPPRNFPAASLQPRRRKRARSVPRPGSTKISPIQA